MAENQELRDIVLKALADRLKDKNKIFVDMGDELLEVFIGKNVYVHADDINKIKARLGKTTIYGFNLNDEGARKQHDNAVKTIKTEPDGEVLVAQGTSAHIGWYVTEAT